MSIDCRTPPAAPPVADHRHIWISPAVLDLGGMRDLTLLQGSGDVCCCFDDPDCSLD